MTENALNPFAIAQQQLDDAAQRLGLDPATHELLRWPMKEYKVLLPVRMDDGSWMRLKIKLDPEVLAKVKKYAKIAGYSSPEEFVAHALDKELSKLEGADSEEEIKKRLQGLGYMS